MQLGGLGPAGFGDRIDGVILVFAADELADLDVNARQLAHGILLISGLVEQILIAVEQDAELRAPIAEVVVGDDGVAQEAQEPGRGRRR